ncbi:MAG TPA: recombinase [Pseudogracilibacillus sp.]|uniref:Recombinase family protein n=1 Tax=Candidatus Atopostipes pullistercoris TaxID=2838467 RepID=A0A9D2G350_9LACT|nr:recombinase [Listeria innocua]HDM8995841.1 recombinase [Listeria innocua]HIZ71275.1 recombinase family protein [Candidatus Atopostipes pullistercoris]HLR42644.1 recombinase [Pseudogracilibacillus sp.]
MAHTPFGYAIVNGKIEVHVEEAEQLKLLIASYLSGQSLDNAARDSGIDRSHGGITRILTDDRYLGNEMFPRLISKDQFEQLKEERFKRAKKLGRLNKTKEKESFTPSFKFTIGKMENKYDNPIKQAEYVYSLIKEEVT